MSVRLHWESCCIALHKGQRCTRPAREAGGYCTSCFGSLNASTRSYLRWEAAWAIEIPEPDVMPTSAMLSDWDIVRAAEAMLGD